MDTSVSYPEGPTYRRIATLSLLSLGLWVAWTRWRAGAGVEFYGWGVAVLAWYALFILALAWAVSRRMKPAVPPRAVLLPIVAFLPVALLAWMAVSFWWPNDAETWVSFLLVAIGLVYLARHLRRLGGGSGRAVLVATMLVMSFLWLTARLWISPMVWYQVEGEEEDAVEAPLQQQERLLFDQPDRVDAAIAAIKPGAPGKAEVFFVGFAGYAEEKVFAEEIALASAVVSRRYGTEQRSLRLVNDRRDLESKPLATVSGLRRALIGLNARMDVEEDVLFLVLSSHGSDDPSLSVSNGILPLDQLDGNALKGALDASDIRWRVIVISACHAGAFINSLKDDNTIILTASRADRTSFGCSDERDLTYFGEAFFRDALPSARSLREAFDSARKAIAARELAEGHEESLPQAHFGPGIEERWSVIELSR
jgi:hypothetical protein